MIPSEKPKRALIAYCALAEKLRTPGVGIMQALTPFLAEACRQFSGELFDAAQFSDAVADRYGFRIPRLAVLGLTEQLAQEGLLTPVTPHSTSTAYKYTTQPEPSESGSDDPVTESEIEAILQSFVEYCREDSRLDQRDDASLQAAFFDRLLNVDSMRLLVRKEGSIFTKKTADTLGIKKLGEEADKNELHIDFLVSQFLLDLRTTNTAAFERVSNVAFANMAAEAIACFQEPSTETSLEGLTVYLDSPLLLDMLGVNVEYEDYGHELLNSIKASGAKAAVMDHCIAEAEAAIHGQLNYLRSGINKMSMTWGTSAKPDLLASLIDNVGERAYQRLGIEVHKDPEVNLHKKSPSTVGDIDAEITSRMQAWRNAEAKEYDRKSVWAMVAIRDAMQPARRICDSKWLLLTRNTPLVGIANDSWKTWLKGTTKLSGTQIEHSSPVAMSEKQFAGYLWTRSGGGVSTISRARLLAHCSAAVRPRADVKARAYNLILELNGHQAAEDVAAILEDREGVRALMRAARGDPDDVTRERMPYILEKVKLAAGEFAAATVRAESEQREAEIRRAHEEEVARLKAETAAAVAAVNSQAQKAQMDGLQYQQQQQETSAQNEALRKEIAAKAEAEKKRQSGILMDGLKAGVALYHRLRWYSALLFGIALWLATLLSTVNPFLSAALCAAVGIAGYSFVPGHLDKPMKWYAMTHLKSVVTQRDASIEIPIQLPDFIEGTWVALDGTAIRIGQPH